MFILWLKIMAVCSILGVLLGTVIVAFYKNDKDYTPKEHYKYSQFVMLIVGCFIGAIMVCIWILKL